MKFMTQQHGAALVTSLIILLVLTLVGITALSTGVIQLRMSSNSQQSAVTFAAAQSAANMMIAKSNTDRDWMISTNVLYASQGKGVTPLGDAAAYADSKASIICTQYDATKGNDVSAIVTTSACPANAWFANAAGGASPVRSLARMYFRGTSPSAQDCPGFDAASGATVGCNFFEVEGTGWLDLDADGVPEPADGETETRIRQWGAAAGTAKL